MADIIAQQVVCRPAFLDLAHGSPHTLNEIRALVGGCSERVRAEGSWRKTKQAPAIRRKAMKTRSTALALVVGAATGAIAVQGLSAQTKAPVYVITQTDISDLDAFQKEYLPNVQASISALGGRRLAAGLNFVVLDGPSPGTRVAINQFDSLEAVQAWRNSAEYKAARKIGDKYAKFRAFAIEGNPQ
jgi:uncharacterized protein (DUF1330 family)